MKAFRMLSAGVLALAACSQGAATTTSLWNLQKLSRPPMAEWGAREGRAQEVYYRGEPYRGRQTRVFAYVARPPGDDASAIRHFPAIVLVHGGGGQAFREWAERWADKGYVALAMDLSGRGPGKIRLPDGGPALGNPNIFIAADADDSLKDGWTYHAVADAVLAHSLLASLPDVDAGRIGITGISWGGYITCIAAAIDHRVKVAVPVYGCGYLQDASFWKKDFLDPMTGPQRARWVRCCDPSSYLSQAACPVLFLTDENDPRFYPESFRRSAELVRPALRHVIVVDGLKHGHFFYLPEVDHFVDRVLLGTNTDARLNSDGIQMMRVPAGRFAMGQARGRKWGEGGEWDESPVHPVVISHAFLMGATDITNRQYERFSPEHRHLRGKRGFSTADDEPALWVSWEDAVAFCRWLSQREGRPYRLPTEAEWEYACRAGTTTPYFTGDDLPRVYFRGQSDYRDPYTNHLKPVALRVAQSPPNAWGLFDMHGLVEQWCADWYGPYEAGTAIDPVGRLTGYARVTRGGSHNTDVYYLRSANRMSALPDDRSCYIGFRVVQAAVSSEAPLPPARQSRVMSDVAPGRAFPSLRDDASDRPYFRGPRPYVVPPRAGEGGWYLYHNHDPAITFCDNGDLLAIWYSTEREWGRELTVLGSRLRHGKEDWEPASLFFDLADRNDHGPALWRDQHGRLYHFNCTGIGGWQGLATILRTSDDNGATWSQPRLIKPDHEYPGACVESVIRARDGEIFLPVDGNRSTELLVSSDNAATWRLRSQGMPADKVVAGGAGHRIAGIHGALVELANGDLFAIGRGVNLEGHSAQSVSHDLGRTWNYAPSPFPPLGPGQRLVMLRLREGPILVVTFTDPVLKQAPFELDRPRSCRFSQLGLEVIDAAGKTRRVFGMFAAVSFDEGKTWPLRKLLTPGGPPRTYFGQGWTGEFVADDTHAEPQGYLAAVQVPDGRIELISSGLHYEFNLAWLKQAMRPAPAAP